MLMLSVKPYLVLVIWINLGRHPHNVIAIIDYIALLRNILNTIELTSQPNYKDTISNFVIPTSDLVSNHRL